MEPCNTRIERTDGKGKGRCCLEFSGDIHTYPGGISIAAAVSGLLNGGRMWKKNMLGWSLSKFKQGVQGSMPELLVWQNGYLHSLTSWNDGTIESVHIVAYLGHIRWCINGISVLQIVV